MNEPIVYSPSPAHRLSISAAPLRELLNFLIYSRQSELLTEHARRQPTLLSEKVPATLNDLKNFLGAENRDKNGKLFFDCHNLGKHLAVLIDNQGAQFWIHYFRCGIGLVTLSFFSHLVSAEGSVMAGDRVRQVTHGIEYQWFIHDLEVKVFAGEISRMQARELGDYFISRVNPTLISPYSIYFESQPIAEPYKFVCGSLERLKEILVWTRFVCEGIKQRKEPGEKSWVNPHVTINCGNLKTIPTVYHSTEHFINVVGALAVKENAPYTVLREGYGRRAGGYLEDWARKNKHYIFLDLEREAPDASVREKIVARRQLINWLKEQGTEGNRIIKAWELSKGSS